jgi:hypothetical protein
VRFSFDTSILHDEPMRRRDLTEKFVIPSTSGTIFPPIIHQIYVDLRGY